MDAGKLVKIVEIIKFNLENSCDVLHIENEFKSIPEQLLISASKNGKMFIYHPRHDELEEMFNNNSLNAYLLDIRDQIFKSTY